MADSTKLVLIGGAAAAVWWFYFRTPAAAGTPAASTPPATGPGNTPITTPVVLPAAPAPNSVAGIQARVLAAANAPAAGLGVDAWGWYLNNELAALGKAAPDPLTVFGGTWDRSQLVPASTYWAAMGPALRSQLGLAGLGLYGFGRLQ